MKKFRKQDSEKYFEEKKPVRLIDTQEYMEMIRALLEDGQEVSMIVTGNSMRPFLKHGRDKICMKKTDRKLRKGDIVFYRRENGQYVMHRILKCGDQSYTLLGDGQIVPESGIRQEQIFARITKVQVRGKWIGSENFRWRFFEHIWIRFWGIRKLGFSFSSKVQNLKKSSKEIHNETVRAAGKWKDGAFQNLVSIIPSFLNSSVSAHRLRELTELPKEIHSMQNQKDLFLTKGGLEVRLENVTFSYTKGKQVFRESDFCACPGEIVALVGTSGEGKTTLLRLILGLIEPDTGKAILKAQDKTEQKLNADTRVCFSYVPQGNTLLAGSIAENLSIAKEGASREEMKTALEMACAWEFVEKLPEGLETKLGERGKGLSEGQSQRIAIARALLRNAPVILLDEATSALDEETEKKLLKNILKKAPEKTCIVTTHRPGVLRLCRRVYRVEDGKIAEQKQDFSGQSDCRTVRHRNFSG